MRVIEGVAQWLGRGCRVRGSPGLLWAVRLSIGFSKNWAEERSDASLVPTMLGAGGGESATLGTSGIQA